MAEVDYSYLQYADDILFDLCKKNDRVAFNTLYDRYWESMVELACKRLQSRHKAEDIVQDIFIDLYQKIATIELSVSLKAYLFQSLKYKVFNEYRSESVRAKYQKSVFFVPVCKNDLANSLEVKELHKKVGNVLAALPEKCRKAFIMSRWEAMSNRDISQRMKISVSTVEKHICKALKHMRVNLKESDVK